MNEPGSAMKRTLLSRSALIFAIRFFPAAATLAVQIAFAHFLPKSLNGLYQQLWINLAVLVAIGCIGIPPLMLTHTSKSVHRWLLGLQARHVSLFGLWLCALAGVLILFSPDQSFFNPWMLVSLFLTQTSILLVETYLLINRKFLILAAVGLLYSLLFCAAHYVFLMHAISFPAMLWLIVLLSALRLCTLILAARRNYVMEATLLRRRIMPVAVRKQWSQLGIYDVSQVIFRFIDKLFIARIVGPALFSIYFIGTTDVPFMPILLSAAGSGLLIQLALEDQSVVARLKLVNYSGAMLGRIVFPVFFFLFFFRYEFIEVVFSKGYLPSVPLFAISILALPLRAYNYTSMLQHLNRVKTINWGALLDLSVALLLAYPLFLWKGLAGVAFAFMICSYIQAAFYLAKTARFMHCSIPQLIPWKAWMIMLIVFGIAGIGLHDVLARYFSLRQTLILGFFGTTIIIALAVLPLIFSKKAHGN